ncbi:hypothetical protein [Pseudomonas nitroreducens]|nr:hypothetical protein [Pseudomonas nitroreducens]
MTPIDYLSHTTFAIRCTCGAAALYLEKPNASSHLRRPAKSRP